MILMYRCKDIPNQCEVVVVCYELAVAALIFDNETAWGR